MEELQQEQLLFLCRSLARATNMAVRLYRGQERVCFESVYPLQPDPAGLFLPQLLEERHSAGVYTTPLYQFYGFAALRDGWRIIVGPSRMEYPDARLMEEQLFLLGVPPQEKEAYLRCLNCVPLVSAERMGWLPAFLLTAVEQRTCSIDTLYVNVRPEEHRAAVQAGYVQAQEAERWQADTQALRDRAYQFEKLILSYIRQGEPAHLQNLLNAPPAAQAGKMSEDTLRQIKNTCVCMATIASRAAIDGGLDSRTAFRMSDLYIQKTELLQDIPSLEKLRADLCVDFAEQVRRVRYRVLPESEESGGSLFASCAEYVAQNIYNPIRAEEMARTLGYTRSYLSSQFRQCTGMTLTQYVLQEKIFEAQRMLEFTDKSLTEIAALFSFSSQSHFQNVFKRVTGETPMEYRKRVK